MSVHSINQFRAHHEGVAPLTQICDQSFWHYLRHNPINNYRYWFELCFNGLDPIIFWEYLSWNCPIKD